MQNLSSSLRAGRDQHRLGEAAVDHGHALCQFRGDVAVEQRGCLARRGSDPARVDSAIEDMVWSVHDG